MLLPKMCHKWENVGLSLIRDNAGISENVDLFMFEESCSICANR